MKLKEIRYTVDGDRVNNQEFDSKSELLSYVNDEALGKKFNIYKVTITRELIKKINKKRPRPCYGGWMKGHRTGFEYNKPKDDDYPTRLYCKSCGYLMKKIYRNYTDPSYVLVRPLVHKDDSE